MLKAIKEFFFGKEPVKAETPPVPVQEVQPVVSNKVDAVSVALDLEPVDLAAKPAEPAKKPRKPRAPKAAEPKVAKPKKEPKAKKAN